jgi:hypothetical protein
MCETAHSPSRVPATLAACQHRTVIELASMRAEDANGTIANEFER